MIEPQVLAERMESTEQAIRVQGPLTWERVRDWTREPRLPRSGERGGGMAEAALVADRLEERHQDAAAARYHAELDKLTKRVDSDMARIRTIISICNPERPASLKARDMLVAQAEADGWCGSCYRVDQACEPVAEGRYRTRCRFCGEWKAENGQDPPLALVELKCSGLTMTTKAVATALAKR